MKAVFRSLIFSLFACAAASMAAAGSGPGTVSSAAEAESVLQMRADFMKGLGSSMKAFGNYLKRDAGDPFELSGMAAQMADEAAGIPDLFPRDTGLSHFPDSESKDNIWTEWDDFVAAAMALEAPARAIEAAFDGGDKGAIGAAVKALGGDGCKNCHQQFREKKN